LQFIRRTKLTRCYPGSSVSRANKGNKESRESKGNLGLMVLPARQVNRGLRVLLA
jgi:hypothetical protein